MIQTEYIDSFFVHSALNSVILLPHSQRVEHSTAFWMVSATRASSRVSKTENNREIETERMLYQSQFTCINFIIIYKLLFQIDIVIVVDFGALIHRNRSSLCGRIFQPLVSVLQVEENSHWNCLPHVLDNARALSSHFSVFSLVLF